MIGSKVENPDRFVDNCIIGTYEYTKYNSSNYENCIKSSSGNREFMIGCLVQESIRKD
jgi:hypothetical protein